MEFTLKIIAEDLAEIDFSGYGGSARLGIQRGKEVVDVVPASIGRAEFTATFRVEQTATGEPNFLGPYAHGTKDARFCYLCWLGGMNVSFGRVKVHLSGLTWEQVSARKPMALRFSLLGKGGKPVFASLRGVVEPT